MNGLPPHQLANWLSLYAATGVCAALAAFGALIAVASEVIRGREWRKVHGTAAALSFVPKLWWRWQKRYLTATPVILAIVVCYGFTLHW